MEEGRRRGRRRQNSPRAPEEAKVEEVMLMKTSRERERTRRDFDRKEVRNIFVTEVIRVVEVEEDEVSRCSPDDSQASLTVVISHRLIINDKHPKTLLLTTLFASSIALIPTRILVASPTTLSNTPTEEQSKRVSTSSIITTRTPIIDVRDSWRRMLLEMEDLFDLLTPLDLLQILPASFWQHSKR